jgi:hypothetical protein
MQPRTTDTSTHERLLADLRDRAIEDDRIRAAWLEGSFARGTADAGSDLDLHFAIADDAFDAFFEGAREWVTAVRAPVGLLPLTFGARRMFAISLADGARLDLFLEPASSVGDPPRPLVPRLLFDHDDLGSNFVVDPARTFNPSAKVREVLDTFLFGFTFPARLSAREEWGSLHLNALLVVFQFLVPAMLLQRHPEQAFRPQLHNERFLDPDQRSRVDALVVQLARAFSSAPPDHEAVRAAYTALLTTFLAELRAAALTHDVPWPEAAEAAIRAFLATELAIELG